MRLGKHKATVNTPALKAKMEFPVPKVAMTVWRNSKNDSKRLRGGRASGSRGAGSPRTVSGTGLAASISVEGGDGEASRFGGEGARNPWMTSRERVSNQREGAEGPTWVIVIISDHIWDEPRIQWK
jgi:hypothetical protein